MSHHAEKLNEREWAARMEALAESARRLLAEVRAARTPRLDALAGHILARQLCGDAAVLLLRAAEAIRGGAETPPLPRPDVDGRPFPHPGETDVDESTVNSLLSDVRDMIQALSRYADQLRAAACDGKRLGWQGHARIAVLNAVGHLRLADSHLVDGLRPRVEEAAP